MNVQRDVDAHAQSEVRVFCKFSPFKTLIQNPEVRRHSLVFASFLLLLSLGQSLNLHYQVHFVQGV